MKYALIIGAILVGIVVVIAIIGVLLPRDHVATVTAAIPAPPDKVWAAITNVQAFPDWRHDLQRVEIDTQRTTSTTWWEHSRHGRVRMAIDVAEPPHRLVVRIADKDLPFGGAWEYVITPDAADATRSRVTVTERGYVSNPIFRFVSRFVMGHYASLESYLRALGKKFGAEVNPTRV
jgi:uncharacterized protein YndB with AHSA1/START domain